MQDLTLIGQSRHASVTNYVWYEFDLPASTGDLPGQTGHRQVASGCAIPAVALPAQGVLPMAARVVGSSDRLWRSGPASPDDVTTARVPSSSSGWPGSAGGGSHRAACR